MSPADTSETPEEPDQPEPASARGAPASVARATVPLRPPAGSPANENASVADRDAADGDRLFTRPFVGLLGMQAAYGFSFSMFFLLPKYLASVGETPSRIGFVMSGFGVAVVLTIPFLPGIIRRLGRRGTLMAANLLLATAGAAFGALDRPGLMAIPLRASEGITWTLMFSTAVTLTAEMAPPQRLAQAIGLAGGASLIMNAVAPAIGEPLADRFGYRWAFLLAAVSAIGAAALARRLPHAPRAARARPAAAGATVVRTGGPTSTSASAPASASASASASADLGAGRIRIYVVFGVAGLAFSVLFTFLAPFALAGGVHAIRTFFISYTIAALMVRVFGGRLADRRGHAAVAAAALTLYGCVVASTGLLGPRHLVVLGIFFGLAHGAAYPALMALLVNGTPVDRRPRALGIANGAMSVGISAVFPAGLLVAHLGYPATFAVAGGLTAVVATLLRPRRNR